MRDRRDSVIQLVYSECKVMDRMWDGSRTGRLSCHIA